MGKKVKKKARSVVQKENRDPAAIKAETTDAVDVPVKVRGDCSHKAKGVSLEKLSAKWPSENVRCEDCRESVADRRSSRVKGKGKKGGGSKSESKPIWICLECGHLSCGGVGLPTTPQSHAVKHAKQNRHPLAVNCDNHQLLWCFFCSKLISVEKSEDAGEDNEVLLEVLKLLKRKPGESSTVDVEDVWFGNGSAGASDYSISTGGDKKSGSPVRGLVNLGNTCFFNSTLQNLLAIDSLRDFFTNSDETAGPLTASLRKLFSETSANNGSKGVINPRSLFGSICSKFPQFRGFQQHDSHELLRCLIDGLSTEELNARKHGKSSQADAMTPITDPTFVDTLFGGKLASSVTCLECGHSSTNFEPILDLSLPVPNRKPQSKRTQPVTRGKKPKLPPKKSGKIRPKFNKNTFSLPAESSAKSTDEVLPAEQSDQIQSNAMESDRIHSNAMESDQIHSNSMESDQIDSNGMADDMGLTHQDLLAIEGPQNQLPIEDGFAWLDYLDPTSGPNDIDMASETDEILVHQVSMASGTDEISMDPVSLNEGFRHSDSLALTTSTGSDSQNATSVAFSDSAKLIDTLEQGVLAQEQSAVSQDEDEKIAVSQNEIEKNGVSRVDGGFLTEEVVEVDADTSNSSAPPDQVCLNDSNNEMHNSDKASQDPVAVPCKDDSCNVQISNGEEEDSYGFGDMFDEPEITSENHTSEASNAAKSGVTIENISSSDPDEVDDVNAPVSVESCLDLFMKPEHLCKEEHAWECDNCSKSLRERKMSSTNIVDTGRNSHDVESINGNVEFEVDASCGSSSQQSCEISVNEDDLPPNQTDMNVISCPPEAEVDENIKADDCQSKDSKGDDNLENLKVKRDATKSILINKAPSILTIHLKRFTPDARGRWSKLNGHVKFREMIDLKPYMDPRSTEKDTLTYRLVGVVEHSGTMRGGHYVAYVRGTQSNGHCPWYYASDAHVKQVSLEEVLRSEAYILFYERS